MELSYSHLYILSSVLEIGIYDFLVQSTSYV